MSDPTGQSQFTDDDLAGMSDEEIMNLDMSHLDAQEPPQAEAPAVPEEEEEEAHEEEEEVPAGDGDPAAAAGEPAGEEDPDAPAVEAEEPPADEPVADPDQDPAKAEATDKKEPAAGKEGEAKKEAAPVDYKAEYEKVFKPFRANGKEITPRSADDVVQLMQMGANYNKKMAGLKPNLKLVKMLENNDLLDENKLSYLIDLSKKNPDAVKKLIKDSGIDPLEIDNEKESEYKPGTYTVDDRQLELDAVLDEIQDTPSYKKTLSLVSTKWDRQSKDAVAKQPQLLKALNDQMEVGIYDRIAAEIEQERMFGRLTGLSDLEAYQKVGDAIHARGGFNDLVEKQTQSQEAPPTERKKIVTPEAKADDPTRKDKKRAAGSTRTAAPSKTDADFNPLAMSDEAFEKLINEKLM